MLHKVSHRTEFHSVYDRLFTFAYWNEGKIASLVKSVLATAHAIPKAIRGLCGKRVQNIPWEGVGVTVGVVPAFLLEQPVAIGTISGIMALLYASTCKIPSTKTNSIGLGILQVNLARGIASGHMVFFVFDSILLGGFLGGCLADQREEGWLSTDTIIERGMQTAMLTGGMVLGGPLGGVVSYAAYNHFHPYYLDEIKRLTPSQLGRFLPQGFPHELISLIESYRADTTPQAS